MPALLQTLTVSALSLRICKVFMVTRYRSTDRSGTETATRMAMRTGSILTTVTRMGMGIRMVVRINSGTSKTTNQTWYMETRASVVGRRADLS